MPPASPEPGCSMGEVCSDRKATRLITDMALPPLSAAGTASDKTLLLNAQRNGGAGPAANVASHTPARVARGYGTGLLNPGPPPAALRQPRHNPTNSGNAPS